MDISLNILRREYEMLESSVTSLQKELDGRNQLIYDCKKQLALAAALEGDFLQEIETLRANNNAEVLQLQKKVKELEEGIATLRHTFNSDLLRKTDLVESLQNEIIELSKNTCKNDYKKRESDGVNTYATRNFRLKEEVTELSTTLQNLQTHIDDLQIQNAELQENNNNLLMELDQVKQNFTNKAQELTKTKNLIHDLQEDIFLTKIELESLKNKPSDATKKGNSLFAEVEDSRIKMQENIKQMEKKYAEMKRDVCNKLKQMTALRARNIELSSELDSVKSCDEGYEKVIGEYNNKIRSLESAIEEYQKEILKERKFTGKDLPSYAVEYANNALKTIWSNGEKARQLLNNESKEKLKTCLDIKSANTEMREWRRKAQQLKVSIEKLENTLVDIQLQNSPSNTADLEALTDVTKQNVLDRFASDYQENKSSVMVEDILELSTVEETKQSGIEDKCRTKHHYKKNTSLMLENKPRTDLFKSRSLNISVRPLKSKMLEKPLLNCSEIEHHIETEGSLKRNSIEATKESDIAVRSSFITHDDQQDRLLVLENANGIEILNDTGPNVLPKSSRLEMNFKNISKHGTETGNENGAEYQCEQNELIILEDTAEVEILNSSVLDTGTELEASCSEMQTSNVEGKSSITHQNEQNKLSVLENKTEIQTNKFSLDNLGVGTEIINLIDSPDNISHSTNKFSIVNAAAGQKQKKPLAKIASKSVNDMNNVAYIESTEFDKDAPQEAVSERISINEIADDKNNLSCVMELEKSAEDKLQSYVTNAGHTPATNRKYRKEDSSEFVQVSNKTILQLYENNAEHTPAACEKLRKNKNEFDKETYGKENLHYNIKRGELHKQISQSCVNNVGHTPGIRQKYRKEVSSKFFKESCKTGNLLHNTEPEESNRKLLESYKNNAEYSAAAHPQHGIKDAMGNLVSKDFTESRKKVQTSKTNIPVPTRRKLN